MPSKLVRWAFRLLAVPLLAAFGAWIIVRAVGSLFSRVRSFSRLLGESLPCPSCGQSNALHGRWRCRAPGCGAVYHGFVGTCGLCGSGASHFSCKRCGVSIPLPRF